MQPRASTRLYPAVDLYVARLQQLLRVHAGLGETREFEELADPDRIHGDRDVEYREAGHLAILPEPKAPDADNGKGLCARLLDLRGGRVHRAGRPPDAHRARRGAVYGELMRRLGERGSSGVAVRDRDDFGEQRRAAHRAEQLAELDLLVHHRRIGRPDVRPGQRDVSGAQQRAVEVRFAPSGEQRAQVSSPLSPDRTLSSRRLIMCPPGDAGSLRRVVRSGASAAVRRWRGCQRLRRLAR